MDEEFGEIVSVYSLERAIADGVLVEVFKNRWSELSQGKPIVATRTCSVKSVLQTYLTFGTSTSSGDETSWGRYRKRTNCLSPQ